MRRRAVPLLLSTAALSACGEGAGEGAERAWPVAVERTDAVPAYDRVVLVTIDTLRADHVSCYGYARLTTPFLDGLAARGVRFTRAMASVSQTTPSHATILTGLAPAVHGVLENGSRLDPAANDLADVFAGAGFETAAFLNVKFLSGIAGSFGTVAVCALDAERRPQTGEDVVDAALAWLADERKGERFFLWVHLYDPHRWKDVVIHRAEHGTRPAERPDGFLAFVAELHGLPAPEDGRPWRVDWHVERKAGESLGVQSAEGFLRCIDAYDELTFFADMQLQRLHRAIEDLALPGRTLWVVTSDHGEGLASHGVAGHGQRIYQEQLRVPLVLHASDDSLAPRVIDELVAHVDLFPTLAEAVGVRVSAHPRLYDGLSLWPLARGESAGWARAHVFAQRRPPETLDDPDQAEVVALQSARHKLILREPPGLEATAEFYDLVADPNELEDLGRASAEAAELEAVLVERLKVYRGLAPAGTEGDVPAEWLQELRDLGYAR